MFGETVKIRDSSGRTFRINISTPTIIRLSIELQICGNFKPWRPKIWGGDWSVIDQGFLSRAKGEVWYRRSGSDFGEGFVQGDVRHLDIFLFAEGQGEDDWGVSLRSFFALNGMTSSGGSGSVDQTWVLQGAPGKISWDIPGRS
jgi:hypothetical protein